MVKAEAAVPRARGRGGMGGGESWLHHSRRVHGVVVTSGQEWAFLCAGNSAPRRQGGAKKGRSSLHRATYTNKRIFRECTVVVVGQRCKRKK